MGLQPLTRETAAIRGTKGGRQAGRKKGLRCDSKRGRVVSRLRGLEIPRIEIEAEKSRPVRFRARSDRVSQRWELRASRGEL